MMGPDGGRHAVSTADYRYLYSQYRSDARLQALHARCAFIHIWDDHEFSDDCWQDRQNDIPGEDAIPRTARRRSANQAFYEYIPADIAALDTANPSFTNLQIYRSLRFGSLATLIMTDERLYRADHIIPEDAVPGGPSKIGSRYLVPRNALSKMEAAKMAAAAHAGLDPLAPVSMLGATQRQWWQTRMSEADTVWKLWGNEVSLLRMGLDGTQAAAALLAGHLAGTLALDLHGKTALASALLADLQAATPGSTLDYGRTRTLLAQLTGGTVNGTVFDSSLKPVLDAALPPAPLRDTFVINADQWDGYNAERKALMAHLKEHNIRNVVALTGDLHAIFAGQVMDDHDGVSPTPVMVDLVTGGISSDSLFSYFRSVVDSHPDFAAARPLIYTATAGGDLANTFNSTLQTFNGDWLKFIDTDARGYAVVTLTPDSLRCDFHKMKAVSDGMAPALPASTRAATITLIAGSTDIMVS